MGNGEEGGPSAPPAWDGQHNQQQEGELHQEKHVY